MRFSPRGLLADLSPGLPLINNDLVFYSVIGGALLAFLLLILWIRGGRRAPVDPEGGLLEKLADYPPPGPGPQRLFFRGQPLRLRLVAIAPMGKRALPAAGALEPLLNGVSLGLGDIARQDRPRIRVWPAQLSQQGFAPTFFRLTKRPEAAGKPSPWVLVAGPARAGGQPILLGLALWADDAIDMGNVSLLTTDWGAAFRIAARR